MLTVFDLVLRGKKMLQVHDCSIFPHAVPRSDFTACLEQSRVDGDGTTCNASHDARTLFRRGWANKALGDLELAAADFETARLLEPLHPHLSLDYRNIFDTELIAIEDIEPLAQAPALFHSW